MKNLQIVWNWFGKNKHGLLEYKDSEFVQAVGVSQQTADILIQHGMNHGS